MVPAMVTLADIHEARRRLGDSVKRTPCERSSGLSELVGADVALKLENLQVTGSFKARGAGNRLLSMSVEDKARGVVCASAGNHAQGVAFHAHRLGVKATIVMPVGTPLIKVARTQALGAEVKLVGENYDESYEEARRLESELGYVYVHAYDDDDVIAGQGTMGLEIAEQMPDVDVVLIPVGGGGLIAGAAIALKAMSKRVKIIGVEASVLPSMKEALKQGAPVRLPAARTLAEGIAVRQVGARCVPLVRDFVDDIVTVEDEEIARAILLLLERDKTVAEGAGAAGVAALVGGKVAGIAGKKVCAVICGGNIDVNVLSRIIERGLVESGRLTRLEVLVPDRPGALAEMLAEVARQRANVVEVHHERAFARGSLGQVVVQVVVETRGAEHANELIAGLAKLGHEAALVPYGRRPGAAGDQNR
jgi:threonine dehydratase